jgi:hypothetical protein
MKGLFTIPFTLKEHCLECVDFDEGRGREVRDQSTILIAMDRLRIR